MVPDPDAHLGSVRPPNERPRPILPLVVEQYKRGADSATRIPSKQARRGLHTQEVSMSVSLVDNTVSAHTPVDDDDGVVANGDHLQIPRRLRTPAANPSLIDTQGELELVGGGRS